MQMPNYFAWASEANTYKIIASPVDRLIQDGPNPTIKIFKLAERNSFWQKHSL